MPNRALRLARLWRRLVELRSWRPLAHVDTLRETLQSLGGLIPEDGELEDWLASVRALECGPALIRAGRAARDWMNLAGVAENSSDAFFLAGCL